MGTKTQDIKSDIYIYQVRTIGILDMVMIGKITCFLSIRLHIHVMPW